MNLPSPGWIVQRPQCRIGSILPKRLSFFAAGALAQVTKNGFGPRRFIAGNIPFCSRHNFLSIDNLKLLR